MATIAPVDTSSFTPQQLSAFNSANALGSGVPTTGTQSVGSFTSSLTQDQATANNQGKPGYDALGNKVQPPITPPAQPPKPITAFSSDSANQTNQTNQQKLAAYGQAGLTMDANGFALNADRSYAEAPVGALPNANGGFTDPQTGINYGIGNMGGKITSDPTTQALYDQFTSLKTQMDAQGAATIANIQQQFQNLIAQQTKQNASLEGSVSQSLLMGGSTRYAQVSSAGQIGSQVSYGLQQIADLNTKEQSAVLAAQQAMQEDAAAALSKTLTDQTAQANKDSAVGAVLASGITDPATILSTLRAQGNNTITAKDVADTIANLTPDAAAIKTTMENAAKNGAPKDVLAAIGQSKTLGDALAAGAKYNTDPTSLAGQYQADVNKGYKGTPSDWVAAQKYRDAYNAEAAKQAFAGSSANQSKLFQQGVTTLKSELSNRSGGLGLQDAKVNQAIHLKNLFDQYKTTVTVPTTYSNGVNTGKTETKTVYNIPPAVYTELAIGVASLVSGTNTVAEGTINNIRQATAQGDLGKALTYATGETFNGSSQQILSQLHDSVDRQGSTAEGLRQTYVDDLIQRLPPDLSPELTDRLVKSSGLNSYTNPTPAQMSPAQIDSNAYSKIQSFATDPKNAAILAQIHSQYPDASNTEVAQQLGLIPTP